MDVCAVCGGQIAGTEERVVVETSSSESEGAERAGSKSFHVFGEWSRHWRRYHKRCLLAITEVPMLTPEKIVAGAAVIRAADLNYESAEDIAVEVYKVMTTDPEEGHRQVEATQPEPFKVGDMVRLKAGAMPLTVVAVEDYGNQVVCEWKPGERTTHSRASLVPV